MYEEKELSKAEQDGSKATTESQSEKTMSFENINSEHIPNDSEEQAPSLELLLYDTEGNASKAEAVASADFDTMLSEYKEALAKTLSGAKEAAAAPLHDEEEEIPTLIKQKELSDSESYAETAPQVIDAPLNDSLTLEEQNVELTESEIENEPEPEEDLLLPYLAEPSEEGEQLELDLGAVEEVLEEAEKEEAPEEENSEQPEQKEKNGWLHSVFEAVELFVFTLVAVMLLTNFVFRHSEVVGSSMQNTLHGGDHLIISDLFYTPKRGDIVVFTSDDGTALVKRVVAIEGDEVDFYFAEGRYLLYINGELQEEDYVYLSGSGEPFDSIENYVIKKGEVFVLGDHRNNSKDSREFGAIDTDRILGKVILRFYPFDKFGTVD